MRSRFSGLTLIGNNKTLLMDTLKEVNIEATLEQVNSIRNADTRKQLAKMIYHRTAGVPNFVAHSTAWLSMNNIGKDTTTIPNDLFGSKFLDYLRNVVPQELNPTLRVNEHYKLFYPKLLALVGATVDINFKIQPQEWKVPALTMMDVLRTYNVHLERNSDRQWDMLFPNVVLDELEANAECIEGLPFWVTFSKGIEASSTHRLLRAVVVNALRMWLMENGKC